MTYEALVVVFDLNHHFALLVCDLFSTRSVTIVTAAATTSATAAIASASMPATAASEEAAALERADSRCDASTVERRSLLHPRRAVPSSRELFHERKLGRVLLDDLFADLELRRRELALS